MSQAWNTAGAPRPAGTDDVSTYLGLVLGGINAAATCYSGTSDPSVGAPSPWGAAEVGSIWVDTTVPAAPVLSIWQQLTTGGPTYGWRRLRLPKTVTIADPSAATVTFTSASPAAADVPWEDFDLSALLATYRDADEAKVSLVRLGVRVRTGASETVPTTDDAYIAFRAKGSADADGERVYAQVANRYVERQVWVSLDASQVAQVKVEVGGGTPAFEYAARLLAFVEMV